MFFAMIIMNKISLNYLKLSSFNHCLNANIVCKMLNSKHSNQQGLYSIGLLVASLVTGGKYMKLF